MSKGTDTERAEARAKLREWLTPGDTIFTVLRHVSSSGMSRTIDAYKIACDPGRKPQIVWLSPVAARALGWTFDRKREAIRISGTGMDMGFHLVNSLSYAVHGTHGEHLPEGTPEEYARPGNTFEHRWI